MKLARKAVLLWGDAEIDWIKTGVAALWICLAQIQRRPSSEQFPISRAVQMSQIDRPTNHVHGTLLYYLAGYRRSKATDPRDKVYSLLGVIRKHSTEEVPIVADYSKSIPVVFRDVVIAAVQMSQSLDVLSYVDHPDNYDGNSILASWVAQWDIKQDVSRFSPNFNACGGRPVAAATKSNLQAPRLLLRGIKHANVSACAPMLSDDNHPDYGSVPPEETFLKNCVHLLASIGPCIDDEQMFALARTLTGAETSHIPYEEFRSASETGRQTFLANFMAWIRHTSATSHIHVYGLVHITGIQEDGDWERYSHLVRQMGVQRRLFKTDTATYGLGPSCMRSDDVIVVLYGGKMPFALRPKGNNFIFLGEVYIDELMDGALVRRMEAGEAVEREFCIV
jgi:hypothetical protein